MCWTSRTNCFCGVVVCVVDVEARALGEKHTLVYFGDWTLRCIGLQELIVFFEVPVGVVDEAQAFGEKYILIYFGGWTLLCVWTLD